MNKSVLEKYNKELNDIKNLDVFYKEIDNKAKSGDLESSLVLGYIHLIEKYGMYEPDMAKKMLIASEKLPESSFIIANLYEAGNKPKIFQKNICKAMDYFRQAALSGYYQAQIKLAKMSEEGVPDSEIDIDVDQAFRFYKMAAHSEDDIYGEAAFKTGYYILKHKNEITELENNKTSEIENLSFLYLNNAISKNNINALKFLTHYHINKALDLSKEVLKVSHEDEDFDLIMRKLESISI